MNILDQIIAAKREEVDTRRRETALSLLQEQGLARPLPVSLMSAMRSPSMGLIAEVKHRSPSAGVIRQPFRPAEIAAAYEMGGAHGISVLMDGPYFGGGEEHFREVREAVRLPMLYKEFVVDSWQVWHARSLGASAVLLIAAALPEEELHRLMVEVYMAGMEVLFEVHNEAEMEMANRLGAPFVGINNRDLKTFVTTLETTHRLASGAPRGATLISESGIRDAQDVQQLHDWGIQGLLVGEHLLRKSDLVQAVQDLLGPFGANRSAIPPPDGSVAPCS